jgi:hypothetical protein
MAVAVREPLSFEQLDARLRSMGFEPGAPATLRKENLIADQRAYRHFRCACGRRGLQFKPYHRGREYRACVVCPAGHAEEV